MKLSNISYGFRVTFPFKESPPALTQLIKEVIAFFQRLPVRDVVIEEVDDKQMRGVHYVTIDFPVCLISVMLLSEIEDVIKRLATHAMEAVALEYSYEGITGINFVGSDTQSVSDRVLVHGIRHMLAEMHADVPPVAIASGDWLAMFRQLMFPVATTTTVMGIYEDSQESGVFYVQGEPKRVKEIVAKYLEALGTGATPIDGLPDSATFQPVFFETPQSEVQRLLQSVQHTVDQQTIQDMLQSAVGHG